MAENRRCEDKMQGRGLSLKNPTADPFPTARSPLTLSLGCPKNFLEKNQLLCYVELGSPHGLTPRAPGVVDLVVVVVL